MDAISRSFKLTVGATLTLPENAKVAESRNKEDFPETPCILTAWKEKDSSICCFSDAGRDDRMKKIGIFIPRTTKPGDTLKIDWVDGNCACAIFANA